MPLLAGCLGDRDRPADVSYEAVACRHPTPCGDGSEWPVGLRGPFAVERYESFAIPMDDGVVLDGGVALPDLPDGVRHPTVLLLTPYVGLQNQPGDTPGILDYTFDAPVRRLVEEGYAFATVSIRGTGNSGGCFSFFQAAEQADAPQVVEWIAAQPWSNGRVGGIGVSYPGTEALMMAVANPPALKTVVVGGTHGDPYLRVATPQGLTNTYFAAGDAFLIDAAVSYAPPAAAAASDPLYPTADHVGVMPERLCEHSFESHLETRGQVGDDRSQSHWDERRLTDRFPDVTAAVWYVQGYEDRGLDFTDDLAWSLLERAPKRVLHGNWGHELPDGGSTGQAIVPDFSDRLVAWLDFWLKGIGASAPGLGLVEYQDGLGAWHASTLWPPAEARSEALYLDGEALAPAAGKQSRSFLAVPQPGYTLGTPAPRPYDPAVALCPGPPLAPPAKLAFASEPMAQDTFVAGNPYAYLHLRSDSAAGQVTLVLFEVAPGFACDPLPEGARVLGWGGADLRYHKGAFAAEPFPVGAAEWVRIDLHGLQEPVRQGHRLVATLSYGDPAHRHATGTAPTLTLDGASFLDLPVLSGGFGARAAPATAPPRPFQPADT
jgi:uncharacterized protein